MALRRNGDGVAPERGCRCAGTAMALRRNGGGVAPERRCRCAGTAARPTCPSCPDPQPAYHYQPCRECRMGDAALVQRAGDGGGFNMKILFYTLLHYRPGYAIIDFEMGKRSREYTASRWNVRNARRVRAGASVCVQVPPPPIRPGRGSAPLRGVSGPQGLRSLPIFGAVSDGTAEDCFSLSSSSQPRSSAGTPGVFVRKTQVNPQKQQKGNKKQ